MFEFSLVAGLIVAPAVGLVATLAMDVVMERIPEGNTPPRVAAGVLTDRPVDEAPQRLATVVHYVAGAGSGLLLLWLLAVVSGAASPLGGGVLPTVFILLLAGGIMLFLMIGFFLVVPLPRARGLGRQRLKRTRDAWSIMAATYVAVGLVGFLVIGVAV